MEATASYLERPPKRKRESSCSRSGPADESRGAKPMEPPNQDSTQVCEEASSARTQERHTHRTSIAGTSHQQREGGIGRGVLQTLGS
jgi:hypothetical protein